LNHTRPQGLVFVLLACSYLTFAQATESSPPDHSERDGMATLASKPRDLLRDTAGVRAQDAGPANDSAPVEASSAKQVSKFWPLGKMQQIRHGLDANGIAISVNLVNDWSANVRGGTISGVSFDRYSLDVSATLDTKKTFGWNGSDAFIRVKNHLGDNGRSDVGDAQGFSNIDDVSRTHLYELWFEQKLLTDRLRFKVGKIDANAEFAVVQIAGDFLNSSMGYSPTIVALPTYPEPKLALNVAVRPKQHYQIEVGVFRTDRDGEMLIVEGGRDWRLGARELGGRSSFGGWRLTGPVACFDGGHLAGTQGFYMVAEQALWSRKRSKPESEEKVSAFLQYGNADAKVSPFTRHLGGGVVLESLFAGRPHDAIGVAATSARFSDDPGAGFQENMETAVELYYKISVKRFLSIVPDFQFIHNPGGLRHQQDAVVLTPRLNISF
jgi:porin